MSSSSKKTSKKPAASKRHSHGTRANASTATNHDDDDVSTGMGTEDSVDSHTGDNSDDGIVENEEADEEIDDADSNPADGPDEPSSSSSESSDSGREDTRKLLKASKRLGKIYESFKKDAKKKGRRKRKKSRRSKKRRRSRSDSTDSVSSNSDIAPTTQRKKARRSIPDDSTDDSDSDESSVSSFEGTREKDPQAALRSQQNALAERESTVAAARVLNHLGLKKDSMAIQAQVGVLKVNCTMLTDSFNRLKHAAKGAGRKTRKELRIILAGWKITIKSMMQLLKELEGRLYARQIADIYPGHTAFDFLDHVETMRAAPGRTAMSYEAALKKAESSFKHVHEMAAERSERVAQREGGYRGGKGAKGASEKNN